MAVSGSKRTELEAVMALHLRAAEAPRWVEQYRFHHKRLWRFDFAWPDERLALECEGGTWLQTSGGRGKGHAHPRRFESDCEKYNEALVLGWRVLRVTGKLIDSGQAVEWVARALGWDRPDEG